MNLLTPTDQFYFEPSGRLSKVNFSCNDVLTDNTKALVYGQNSRGHPGTCPRLWHNGCYSWTGHLWVFISHNGWWQVIREDFNYFRGDDGQRTSSLTPSTPTSSLQCYVSRVTKTARIRLSAAHADERGRAGWTAEDSGVWCCLVNLT